MVGSQPRGCSCGRGEHACWKVNKVSVDETQGLQDEELGKTKKKEGTGIRNPWIDTIDAFPSWMGHLPSFCCEDKPNKRTHGGMQRCKEICFNPACDIRCSIGTLHGVVTMPLHLPSPVDFKIHPCLSWLGQLSGTIPSDVIHEFHLSFPSHTRGVFVPIQREVVVDVAMDVALSPHRLLVLGCNWMCCKDKDVYR